MNWNTAGYLERWLPGVISSCKGLDAEVIVADNASTDGSLELMQRNFPGVRTIALNENYGFTGGYNRALNQIEAKYFLLLNSDVCVQPGWLQPLVDWMDTHPLCAVCGPKLHKLKDGCPEFEYAGAAGGYIDRYGYPFCRGRVLSRTEKDSGQYDLPREVLWVSGACLLTRSSVWKQLGGLDNRFFAHMEEIDYCWRSALAGYSVCVVPDSSVLHLGGGTLPQTSPFKLKLNYRNNLLMLEKNLPGTIGHTAARSRISLRKALDWCSAAVYLVQGKRDCAAAVRDAHREAYSLLRQNRQAYSSRSGNTVVRGYCSDIPILLLSLMKGQKIFNYLKNYEDRHSWGR